MAKPSLPSCEPSGLSFETTTSRAPTNRCCLVVLNRSQQWCTNCAWRAYRRCHSLTANPMSLWGWSWPLMSAAAFFLNRSNWQLAAVAALLWHQHGGLWLIALTYMDQKTEALHLCQKTARGWSRSKNPGWVLLTSWNMDENDAMFEISSPALSWQNRSSPGLCICRSLMASPNWTFPGCFHRNVERSPLDRLFSCSVLGFACALCIR